MAGLGMLAGGIDPVSIGLMGLDAVTGFINMRRGARGMQEADANLAAMGDAPNYTLSADYDRMVNAALNAPQLGQAAAERAYGDQAAAAAMYGSRGLGSLGAAAQNQANTLNSLEQQRIQNIQNAYSGRAGAAQGVMDANVLRGQQTYDIERDRLLEAKTQAEALRTAGQSSLFNIGGGLLAGATGLVAPGEQNTFFAGLQTFLNPQEVTATTPAVARGMRVKELKAGDSIKTKGPEDHDKLEYLISKMVKTKNGVRLEPVARSTGQERHQVNSDGEITVTNSKQEKSLQDGYEHGEKTGDWSEAIDAMRRIFSQKRFKN